MKCTPICTRTTYHSLQSSNGNFLDASEAVTIPAGNTQIFVLPANCVLIGFYYNDAPLLSPWKFCDMLGGFGFGVLMLCPYSMIQSEVFNRASGETNINSVININKNLKDMFSSCGMIQQEQKDVSLTNGTAANFDIKICYIRYDWIFSNN